MKKLFLLVLLFSTLLITGAFAHSFVQRIYPTEIENTEQQRFSITFYNRENYKLDDATLSVSFPDLYIKGKSSQFDLKSKDARRMYLEVDFPENLKPGYYPVIFTIQNEDVRQKKHSWIQII